MTADLSATLAADGTIDPAAMELRATAALRAAGRRVTRPRVAVLAVLLRSEDRHMSADEVLAAVSADEPAAHRATVYRTLESLTSDGLLHHVHLDRGLTTYHVTVSAQAASLPRAEHLHAQCRECAKIVDLPPDALDAAARTIESATGFQLDASHVALSGLCADCTQTVTGHSH